MNEWFTTCYDMKGKPIFLGNRLHSIWNYDVIVCKDENGFYGKLICEPGDSCENIPYALNDGNDYCIVENK